LLLLTPRYRLVSNVPDSMADPLSNRPLELFANELDSLQSTPCDRFGYQFVTSLIVFRIDSYEEP
jgi:hypothetical protein